MVKIQVRKPAREESNPERLAKVITDEKVTFAQMTPGLFELMWKHLKCCDHSLRFLILGGERFPDLTTEMMQSKIQFYNAYGVTEMSVWQSLLKIESCGEAPIYAKSKNKRANHGITWPFSA